VREDLDEAHVVIALGDDAPALLRAAAYAWGASVFFLWPLARELVHLQVSKRRNTLSTRPRAHTHATREMVELTPGRKH
jgi:hypothetical protein